MRLRSVKEKNECRFGDTELMIVANVIDRKKLNELFP